VRDINSPEFREAFAIRQRLPPDAVPTHLPALNSLMHDDGGQIGFGRGWFVTLAGLTGHGKSITALNFCLSALRAGETVCYCSLEMSAQQIAARFYAMAGSVPVIGLERGSFDERIWSEAQKGLALPSLLMPDKISGRWEDVVAFIRQAVEERGATYVILDYLQLTSVGSEQDIMRAISEVTTDLRTYAANNGVIALVLSQFNRHTSADVRVRPRMTGLWGGAYIEQSSDCVLLLSHHAFERDGDCSRTFIQVEKNRHGMVGDIPVLNSYRDLSQRQAMPDELHEWPEP
jgi:replicative DNA helicase